MGKAKRRSDRVTEFLSVKDVCQILNLNRWQVEKRLRNNELPGVKIGTWRIPKGELQRWMDEKGMRRDIDYVW
jgi:excisionase family DNA binding protein